MVGKTISHYKIIKKLGEGGMGVVYKAQDTNLEREVAIKFLPAHIASNADEQAKFRTEAKASAALNHRNIATIHSIEEANGEIFIVLEYIQGIELQELIDKSNKENPLKISSIYNYATQIARGMQAAHKKKIVHRDIKSSNIMITESSQIKVMDFGLAKIGKDDNSDFSKSTIGTAAYMSPEQAMGADVDHRSDIWSLGVVLYEMICGELPFQGDYEQAILFSIQNEDITPVIKKRADVPEVLNDIVNKCLTRDPEKRYQAVIEMLEDFDLLKADNPTIDGKQIIEKEPENIKRRLAVLPISNFSPDPEDEYFAVGMTEELITTLSKIKELRLIARASVMQYKTTSKSIKEIGKELNVGAVLQGSIRKSNSQIRVSVQLIETRSEEHLWSQEYNKVLTEVFEIQSDIAKSVANALKIKLLKLDKEKVEEPRTKNHDAYELFLKGRFFWNKRTKEDLEASLEFLEQATNVDPEFAIAWAALADVYIILNDYNYMDGSEAFPKALHCVQKALELDNELAQAYASFARINTVYDWDFKKAGKAFEYAIKLDPQYATVHHWYAINYLVPQQKYDEALSHIFQALEIDPLSLIINTSVGLIYYFSGDFDNAIKWYESTVLLEKNFGIVHHFASWAYAQKGMAKEAERSMKTAILLLEESDAKQAELGCIYAIAGFIDKAEVIAKKIEKNGDKKDYSAYTKYSIAALFACLKNEEKAVSWLLQAFEEKSYRMIYLKTDPWFKSLLENLEIEKMLIKIGL